MVRKELVLVTICSFLFFLFMVNETFFPRNFIKNGNGIRCEYLSCKFKEKLFPFEKVSVKRILKLCPREIQKEKRKNLTKFTTIFIDNYIDYHNRYRKLCQRDREHREQAKLLIYGDIHRVGIGDRIRGMMYTFLIASFTGRIFLLSMSDLYPFEKFLNNGRNINLTYDKDMFPFSWSSGDVRHSAEFKSVLEYDSESRVVISNDTSSFDISLLLSHAKAFSRSRRKLFRARMMDMHLERADIAPLLLKELFQPSEFLRQKLSRRLNEYNLEAGKYLALHARFGYGIGEVESRFNLSRLGLTSQSASLCLGRAAGREALKYGFSSIFISSDTRILYEPIMMGIREISPDVSVAAARGKALHTGSQKISSNFRKDIWNGFVRAFVDLSVIGNSKRIVSLKSGFADAASWVAAITDLVTVDLSKCPEARLKEG